MFGYVQINKPKLKMNEFEEYRSYYCGLCKALQSKAGIKGQISLSYDMTFLAMLLTMLYEPEETEYQKRCMVHPFIRHRIKKNEMIDYVADMNVILNRYKCRDDYLDEKNLVKAGYGFLLNGFVRKCGERYERQILHIEKYLNELHILEQDKQYDIDKLSGCFGQIMGEVFVVKQDQWEGYLRKIGFYLGKFVYIMDAYEDVIKDKKKGCFNPFYEKETEADFNDWVKKLLIMTAAEFAREFEKLPIVDGVEILRNIIYSGIWIRYEEVKAKRCKEKDKNL